MNVGRAYGIMKGRQTGDKAEASDTLQKTPANKRRAMNRHNSRRNSRRRLSGYKVGERVKFGRRGANRMYGPNRERK